jgi:hypothetical protein
MSERYLGRVSLGVDTTLVLDIDDLDSENWRGIRSHALVVPSDRTVGVTLVRYTVGLLNGRRAGQMATAGNGIRDGHVVLEGDRRFGPAPP